MGVLLSVKRPFKFSDGRIRPATVTLAAVVKVPCAGAVKVMCGLTDGIGLVIALANAMADIGARTKKEPTSITMRRNNPGMGQQRIC
jgi:hypothetical protein